MKDRKAQRLSGLLGLLWQKDSVDVREHTAGSNGYRAQELVELLVVADGELDVARDDACLGVGRG